MQLECCYKRAYVVSGCGQNLRRCMLKLIQNLHDHRVERKPYAVVEGRTKLYPTGRRYFFSKVILFREGVTFGLGKCVLGPSRGSKREGAPENTNSSATTSRTDSTGVCPLFLSIAHPGALGAPCDEELTDVPLEEELVDSPSEEELTDVPSEDELVAIPAEEELELGICAITRLSIKVVRLGNYRSQPAIWGLASPSETSPLDE
ncbi:hypothetical protein Cgig2_012094 [Carnegiea gigantea]|uniref:Uncharacterized protein n=1 Tax=Carnegiea gigantea TaxID=171969 RepID=A0A9Q1GFT5_9CARY|nr:hypothetical protein Cgig2_012094 [Carnegiea gigantea]